MRRLLIGLVVVAVLLAFGDTVFRNYVEGRAAAELKSGLSLSDEPDVEIGGWPFSIHLVAQSFPWVEISGRDVEIEGVAVTRFTLKLDDVEFSLARLAGPRRSIDVQSGSGTISLTSELVSERLGAEGLPFQFSIDGDQATLSAPELGGSVSVEVTLDDHSLSFDPPGFDPVSIDLPVVADLVEYRSVSISGDAVRARFHLSAGRIDLSR